LKSITGIEDMIRMAEEKNQRKQVFTKPETAIA
jgi:hypothetical protein